MFGLLILVDVYLAVWKYLCTGLDGIQQGSLMNVVLCYLAILVALILEVSGSDHVSDVSTQLVHT